MFVSFCGRLPAVPGKDSTLSGDAYKGKYILLTLLTQHVPVGSILETSPDLPQELLRAMGHQVLACHVSLIMCSVKAFPIQLPTFCTKYSYSVFVLHCTLLGDWDRAWGVLASYPGLLIPILFCGCEEKCRSKA